MWKISTIGETAWLKFYNSADTTSLINVAVVGTTLFAHFEGGIIAFIDPSNGFVT